LIVQRRRQVDDAELDRPDLGPPDGSIRFLGTRSSGPRHRHRALGILAAPEAVHCFRADRAPKPRHGRLLRRDNECHQDIEQVFTLFPGLQSAKKSEGGTIVRGEQQMLRDRPGADGAPESATARRAVDG